MTKKDIQVKVNKLSWCFISLLTIKIEKICCKMKGGHGGKGGHSIHKQSVIETEIVDRDVKQNSYLSVFQVAFLFLVVLRFFFMHYLGTLCIDC